MVSDGDGDPSALEIAAMFMFTRLLMGFLGQS